ncbi:titin-like isoform X2 [Hydra vulgaris]|uniref:Titin-like isoform X2 n=1 Tax=Hydra vulgaris TaxID=6087 RepID=A0ABM4C7D1_HYDVU
MKLKLRIFIFSVFAMHVTNEQILVTVENQTYQEGVDANLTCVTASSVENSTYNWFFGSKLLYSSNTSNTLTIKNVIRIDAGNYLCQIITAEGVTANSTGNLYVLYQDTPSFTNLDPHPVEGTNVTFNCTTNASVNLTYQIFKNNVSIANSSYYVIHNIQRTDSGQYSCTSSSSRTQISKTFSQDVNVLYQDTPSFTNLDPYPVEGTNVTFNCTTIASVNLTYQIFKNNVSIANTSYFVIHNIQKTDSGQYSCTSSSSRTQISKTFSQDVNVLYQDTPTLTNLDLNPVEGTNVTFNCTTNASVNLTYQIFKNNVSIANSSYYVIHNIQRTDSGQYSCTSSSSRTQISKTFSQDVNVLYQDTPTLTNLDLNPVEGTNVTFNCTTNASVNLTYQIFKNNVSIANSSYYVIHNIQRTDSGQYSCTSSSSRTQISKTFSQDVNVLYQDTPSFTNLDPYPVEGTNVTFNCTTNASVNLTYQIFKNNVSIANSSYYVIHNIQRTDSGQYSCTSSSSRTQISKTFSQDVNVLYQDTPTFTNLDPYPVEGTNVTFNCTTIASVNLTYQIFKNNVSIANTSYFVIHIIQRTDSGQYSCTSSSSRTQISKTFSQDVNVLYQDTPTFTNLDPYPVEGTNVTFNCTTNASVNLTYQIFKNNVSIANSSYYVIHNIQRTDSGQYSCTSSSSRTQISKTFSQDVNVLYQDTPTFTNLDLNPVEGTNVTFNCTTNASVNLTYQIFKNNVSIANSSYYVIHNIQRTDSGQYSCTSSSSRTQISKTFSQDVNVLYQDTPSFTNLDPYPVEGTNVTFNCTTNASVNLTYQIFKNNVSIANSSYYVIHNIQRTDSGQYSCTSSSSRTQISKTFSQDVNVLYQDTPSFTNLDPYPVEGTNVTFNCTTNASVNLTYQIFQNNVSIANTSYFVIHNIQRTDSGQYSCTSSSSRTQILKTFYQDVNVLYQDTLSFTNLDPYPIEGTNVTFNCTTIASVNLTYQIFKNNVSIANTSYFIIHNIQRTDSGQYSCTSSSSRTQISKTFSQDVNVLYQDTPSFTNLSSNPFEGTNVTFNCTTNASVNLTYQIFKNNVSIANTSYFVIHNIQRTDSGQYSCTSSSSRTQISKTFSQDVNVLYQDTPTFTNLDLNPVEGTNVTFNCTTNASVNLTYQIFKNNVSIANTSYFVIHNIQRTDSGQYSCTSSSSRTQLSKTFSQDVNVLYQDTPSFTNLDQYPVEGTNVTFNCSTNASVNLTYQIFQNNVSIANTSYFVIHNIQRTDSGQYSCMSSSSRTQISKTFSQDVNVLYQDTPSFTNLSSNPFEGTNVTFNCTTNASVNLTYQIFKNNVSIANTSYFVIVNIQRTDSGQYSCMSSSSITQISKTSSQEVNVLYPPNALYFSNNISDVVNVKITQNFTVQCCTTDLGVPIANLSWYSKGKENLSTAISNKCISLSIMQVSRNSSSRYTCYANSFLNVANKSLDLTVQEVPDSPKILPNITITFMSIWLQWLSQFNGNDPIINYKLSYQINGSLITPYTITVNDTMYNITGLDAFTLYRIDIRAVNGIGESQSATLYIQTNETAPPPYNGTLPVVVDSDVTQNTFKIQLVSFSDIYGPIRKRDIVVVKLSSGSLPTTSPSSYSDDNISNRKDGLYRAGTVSSDVTEFIVGSGQTSKRKRKSLTPQNPALDSGTYYTVFIRGYVSDDKYQTTNYYPPVKTQTNTSNAGTIIAIVVPIVFTVVVLILAILKKFLKKKSVSLKNNSLEMSSIENSMVGTMSPKAHISLTKEEHQDPHN